MDVIDLFLEEHAALRAALAALEAPFRPPHGVGWDDCLPLDRARLMRDAGAFFAAYRAHEAEEDGLLAEASARVELEDATRSAFAESRRAVSDVMKLFNAVVFACDGEHVHRVREVLSRMRDEVEAHLAYEEKLLFPLLRERLPAATLGALAQRARAPSA